MPTKVNVRIAYAALAMAFALFVAGPAAAQQVTYNNPTSQELLWRGSASQTLIQVADKSVVRNRVNLPEKNIGITRGRKIQQVQENIF
jgi:hypothetical protein